MNRPAHGDTRNERVESTWTSVPAQTPDGQAVEGIGHGSSYSVSERYCARCDKWILVVGVVGALGWMALHRDHGPSEAGQ